MATVEELVVEALSRAAEFGNEFTTRSVLYTRLGRRQQALFALAARWNPEYYGECAVGTLDANGAVDALLLGDPAAVTPVESIELVSKVEIADHGTSTDWEDDDEVNVVAITDQDGAEYPPRVTIRGGAIRQVGTDLDNVTSLRIYYSRRPFRLGPGDAETDVELEDAFQDLLVIDLTRWLLRKIATLQGEQRQVVMGALDVEEKESLANYEAHVRAFTAAAERGRFGRTAGETLQ